MARASIIHDLHACCRQRSALDQLCKKDKEVRSCQHTDMQQQLVQHYQSLHKAWKRMHQPEENTPAFKSTSDDSPAPMRKIVDLQQAAQLSGLWSQMHSRRVACNGEIKNLGLFKTR